MRLTLVIYNNNNNNINVTLRLLGPLQLQFLYGHILKPEFNFTFSFEIQLPLYLPCIGNVRPYIFSGCAGYIDDPVPHIIVHIAVLDASMRCVSLLCIQLNYVVVSGQFFLLRVWAP
jgi:hypothetical protein